MINRMLPVFVVLIWLLSMGWLIQHDVVPGWTAHDIYESDTDGWLTEEKSNAQARIENKYGHRLGTVWSQYRRVESALLRKDVIWIDGLQAIPKLRVEMESTFTSGGVLDSLVMSVFGAGERVELIGENFSGHFAFELSIGSERKHRFKVDADMAGIVSDVFRPFPNMPKVEVGDSWRMHVLNPIAAVSGVGTKLIPLLVKVTGKEMILSSNGPIDCLVLEAGQARAWVDSNGVVIRQEMDLPVGGTLSIITEAFNQDLLDRALAQKLDSGHVTTY